mgnify:CR=1 FL=1
MNLKHAIKKMSKNKLYWRFISFKNSTISNSIFIIIEIVQYYDWNKQLFIPVIIRHLIAWHILRYTGNTWIPSCGPSKQYQCHLAHLHGLSKSRLIPPYNIYKFLQVLFLHVCTFRLPPPSPWVLTQANACWMPSLSYVHKLKLLRNMCGPA